MTKNNQHIIITGASKGIGKAIANSFAALGNTLYLCARNEVDLYNTIAELQTNYPQSVVLGKTTDMANKEEVLAFANWVNKQCVADIIINNAGQFLPGSVHSEEDGLLEQMMAVNVYSAYHLTRALLPAMMQAKKGYIFNICSIASLQAYSNGGSYSISKFALMGFSKNLREELKEYNIKVVAVYPGAVLTNSWGDFDNSQQRIMEANDVATMIIAATNLSQAAVVEDMVLRPQLGDL
jgi:short-subunit dehydrogenase